MKKQIFWHIQHIDEIGGTEMVSTDLMNHLCDDYDITCIISSQQVKEDTYDVDPRIKRFYLNIPHKVTRFDVYLSKYSKEHKILSLIDLFFKAFVHFFLKRPIYRRRIKKLVKKNNGILISSAADSYLFAPKGITTYFHFHFNSVFYSNSANKVIMMMSRKPDKYIFLSKTTEDIVVKENPKLKGKTSSVFNPVRFKPELDLTYYNNRILFVGRFMDQKDPILALQVVNELKNRNFQFHFDMFGEGPLQDKMEKYILENNLSSFVDIHAPTTKIKSEFIASDLLLLTSKFEGFGLVNVEANSMSTPTINSNWGDTVIEVCKDGINGFVVNSRNPSDYADKIIEILSNKDYLKNLKESSYNSSFDFTYDKIIGKWKEILG